MLPEIVPVFGSEPLRAGGEGAWVWLGGPADEVGDVLSCEESARVAKIVDPDRRTALRTFLSSRKVVLSALLGCPVAEVRIDHDGQGRPFLPCHPDTQISLSDSEGLNALATSRSRAVGIDVERIRPIGWEPMLGMMSDEPERSSIRRAVEGGGGLAAFFRCWTAKEAVLKAAGTGMRGDARRVCLPSGLVRGEEETVRMVRDGVAFRLDTAVLEGAVVSRAVCI